MAKNRKENPLELGSGSVVAIGLFLLAWNVVEVCTGTVPFKDAPPGTTQLAASQAGAMVTPSDRGSARDQSPGEAMVRHAEIERPKNHAGGGSAAGRPAF